MKPLIKVLILILVCVLAMLAGCAKDYAAKKDYITVPQPGFNQDIIRVKSLEFEKQAAITEVKGDLVEFKSFSDELFPMWAVHINTTSLILDDFNGSATTEEKSGYSRQLEQGYLAFRIDLENIKPPAIAVKAYGLAVESVSYRVLFFKQYNENAPVRELNEIEGKAYIAEAGFWTEIDNIYRYFDKEMAVLGKGNDNMQIAFE